MENTANIYVRLGSGVKIGDVRVVAPNNDGVAAIVANVVVNNHLESPVVASANVQVGTPVVVPAVAPPANPVAGGTPKPSPAPVAGVQAGGVGGVNSPDGVAAQLIQDSVEDAAARSRCATNLGVPCLRKKICSFIAGEPNSIVRKNCCSSATDCVKGIGQSAVCVAKGTVNSDDQSLICGNHNDWDQCLAAGTPVYGTIVGNAQRFASGSNGDIAGVVCQNRVWTPRVVPTPESTPEVVPPDGAVVTPPLLPPIDGFEHGNVNCETRDVVQNAMKENRRKANGVQEVAKYLHRLMQQTGRRGVCA